MSEFYEDLVDCEPQKSWQNVASDPEHILDTRWSKAPQRWVADKGVIADQYVPTLK